VKKKGGDFVSFTVRGKENKPKKKKNTIKEKKTGGEGGEGGRWESPYWRGCENPGIFPARKRGEEKLV